MKRFMIMAAVLLAAADMALALNAPSNIAISSSGTDITLQWYMPVTKTGDKAIQSYKVYRATYANVNDINWNIIGSEGKSADVDTYTLTLNTYVDAGANTSAGYYYRVQAVDSDSIGGTLTSAIVSYPYGPQSLTVTAYNAKTALEWDTGYDAQITGYNIYRSTSPAIPDLVKIASSASGKYTDPSVYNGRQYFYSVRPYLGTVEGSMSLTKSVVPFAPPYSPVHVSSIVSVGGQVTLNWAGQTLAGTFPVSCYNIYRTGGGGPAFSDVTFTAGYTEALTAGEIYTYSVSVSDSMANTSLPYTLKVYVPGLPSKPQGFIISDYRSFGASLTWAANDPLEGVTFYRIFRDSLQVQMNALNYASDTGLTEGNTYTYYVVANNAAGDSVASDSAVITAKASPPTDVTVVKGQPGELAVTWAGVPFTENVTGYNVYRAELPGAINYSSPWAVTETSSFIDSGLNTAASYVYAVSGFTSMEGQFSSEVSGKAVTLPADVTGLSLQPNTNYINLAWDLPDVSYETSAYNIYRATDSGAEYSKMGTTVSAFYQDRNLLNTIDYYYKITSLNYYGESTLTAAAAQHAMTSPAAAPDAPRNPVLVSTGDGKISINWSAAPPGSLVTAYNVYRSMAPGVYADAPVGVTLTTASFTDTPPLADTVYYYTVKAVSTGESPASAEVSGKAYIKPGSPRNLQLDYLNSQVMLTWEKPVSDGTYPYQYKIYRGTSVLTIAAAGITTTSLKVFDGAVNTMTASYYYRVRSIDTQGHEDSGTDYTVITISSPVFPPSVLVAKPGPGRVMLVWRKVSPDYYNIYRRTVGSLTERLMR